MTNLIRLRVPPGAADADISHGTQNFRPWLVDPNDPETELRVSVPPEAAVHLIHNAGFEMVNDLQAPPPVGMALLAHPEGPEWPDGSPRTFGLGGKAVAPRAGGLYEVPVHMVPEAGAHGLDAPERVFAALKTKIEEKLGGVDEAELNREVAAAVKRAVAQAEADRDAAVQHAATLQVELSAIKKELAEERDNDLLQDKEIRALKAEVDAKERQITELLNKEQVAEPGGKVDKKK
jgi:hypothetical protein